MRSNEHEHRAERLANTLVSVIIVFQHSLIVVIVR